MSTTATKKKTTTADAKHPLSPSLRSVNLAEARQALSDLDSRDGVIRRPRAPTWPRPSPTCWAQPTPSGSTTPTTWSGTSPSC